jgi:MFS superfamily sulfate permease-like transporter
VAVELFDLAQQGVAIVGDVDSGLPSFGLSDAAAHRYLDLAASAVGVMLVGFAEGLGAAKAYVARHHYEIDANRELVAEGPAPAYPTVQAAVDALEAAASRPARRGP